MLGTRAATGSPMASRSARRCAPADRHLPSEVAEHPLYGIRPAWPAPRTTGSGRRPPSADRQGPARHDPQRAEARQRARARRRGRRSGSSQKVQRRPADDAGNKQHSEERGGDEQVPSEPAAVIAGSLTEAVHGRRNHVRPRGTRRRYRSPRNRASMNTWPIHRADLHRSARPCWGRHASVARESSSTEPDHHGWACR